VSSHFAMIKAGTQIGWTYGDAMMLESLIAFTRAGVDAVLAHTTLEAAESSVAGVGKMS